MTQIQEEERLAMNWLSEAIQLVHCQQPELWALNVGERARVAQIFVALLNTDPFIGRWRVDLEWNRQGAMGQSKRQSRNTGGIGTPDIVVHDRGRDGSAHNLLVVEFKNVHTRGANSLRDREKVEIWMDDFSYRFGAVVALGPSGRRFGPVGEWLRRDNSGTIVAKPWLG